MKTLSEGKIHAGGRNRVRPPRDKLVAMLEGRKRADVADELKVGWKTVHKWCRLYGIETDSDRRAPVPTSHIARMDDEYMRNADVMLAARLPVIDRDCRPAYWQQGVVG